MRDGLRLFGRRFATVMMGLLLALAPPITAGAEVYVFDPGHTNITFSWNHLGLSRQSGRILEYEGTLEFDPLDPTMGAVEVRLRTASVFTGVPSLDRDLKSSDFLNAARFPEMTFRSTLIRKTGERTGEVVGDLTIMGQTRPVILQVQWNYTGEHPLADLNPVYKGRFVSGFSARTTILRSEWGVKRAIPLVSDEIEISIETEVSRRSAGP